MTSPTLPPPPSVTPEGALIFWYHRPVVWITTGVVLCLGLLSMPAAFRTYRQWSARQKVQRATQALVRGEYQAAVLDARGALAFNAKDGQALRILAQTAEAMKAPEAVKFRRQIDVLEPGQAENLLALTEDLLEAGDGSAAEQALRGVASAARESERYHAAAARLAVRQGDRAAAEVHWARAAELAPAQVRYQIELAKLRLDSRDEKLRAQAIAVLDRERQTSGSRLEILRALLADALTRGESGQALAWVDALCSAPEATFSERLTRLSALRVLVRRKSEVIGGLHALTESQFTQEIEKARAEAAKSALGIYQMIAWMNTNDQSLLVPDWAATLPPATLAAPPSCVALAEAYARGSAWKKLQALTEKGPWTALEHVRQAYLARALDGLGDSAGGTAAWNRSLQLAEERPALLEALCQETAKWGWEQRTEQALWRLAAKGDCPRWAADTLWRSALVRRDTPALWKASKLILQAEPTSVSARNNFIHLSLLTGQDLTAAHRLAAALYQENLANVTVASTYGYSQLLQGHPGEAAQLVTRAATPASAGNAFYQALFLAAAGRADEAEPYFALGRTTPKLPEEIAMSDLLGQAFAAHRQWPSDPDGGRRAWKQAMDSAGGQPALLEILFTMARGWQLEEPAGAVALKLMDADRCPPAAMETLWNAAVGTGDLTTIHKAAKLGLAKNPTSFFARNAFATAALLTKSEIDSPQRLAEALAKEFPGNPEVAVTQALSLLRKNRAEEAISLLRALKPEERQGGRPALYFSFALAAAGQPDEAAEYVQAGAPFAQFPEEKSLVHMLQATYLWHSLAAKGAAEAPAAWKEALAAANRSDPLETLGRVTLAWGANDEASEALWKLAESNDCPRWAADFLWKTAEQRRDTGKLYLASRLLRKAEPKNVSLRNNFVWLSLLTGHENEFPHREADALVKENPGHAEIAATGALSLYLRGKTKEAVALLAKLTPEQLQAPRVSFYYGLVLMADGQTAKAGEYLQRGANTSLPEERSTLEKLQTSPRE